MSRVSICHDFFGVTLLAVVSLAVGLIWNDIHGPAIPLVYQTPQQRLAITLTKLVNAPPFQVSELQTIGLHEFRSLADSKRTLILDARAAPFYRQGHVPGALNLAREDFAHDYQALPPALKADRDRPIVVYCSGGSCHDSKLVASALLSLGFSNVRVFTGGWEEWTQAGLATAKD